MLVVLRLAYYQFLFTCILHYLQAKEQICRLIQTGVESGAKLVLDGRNSVVRFFYSLLYYTMFSAILLCSVLQRRKSNVRQFIIGEIRLKPSRIDFL